MTEKQEKAQELIAQLQYLEQNLQNLLVQKQTVQNQLIEIDTALEEIKKQPKKVYKILGSMMMETSLKEIGEDLNARREISNVKIKSIEKQEQRLRDNSKSIQEEVLKMVENNG